MTQLQTPPNPLVVGLRFKLCHELYQPPNQKRHHRPAAELCHELYHQLCHELCQVLCFSPACGPVLRCVVVACAVLRLALRWGWWGNTAHEACATVEKVWVGRLVPVQPQAPFAVASLLVTGIHPSTARVVGVDVMTFDADDQPVDSFFSLVNPREDIGPAHLHGLRPEDVARAPRFGAVSGDIARLVDGASLIVHNAPRSWGFLVSESHRAVDHSRSRGKGRQQRRRRPQPRRFRPEVVVDTLASLRRQGVYLTDTRVAGCAATLGLDCDPVASVERAAKDPAVVAREATEQVWWLYRQLRDGVLAVQSPKDLRADRFGLQRPHARVRAAGAARTFVNPGHLEGQLVQGMEFVIAPEIVADPTELIVAGVDAGLAYSEKLSRQTSVVVCNESDPEKLAGKAMHGDRKGIPLVSDVEFLRLLGDVRPGLPAPTH